MSIYLINKIKYNVIQMNPEAQLARILQQNRIRQANFYAKNKDAINTKRREIYKAGREKLQPQEEEEEGRQGRLGAVAPEEEEEPIQTNFSKKRVVSYQQLVSALNSLDINQNTKAKYLQDLKRLMNLTDCNDNIIKCFRNYKNN